MRRILALFLLGPLAALALTGCLFDHSAGSPPKPPAVEWYPVSTQSLDPALKSRTRTLANGDTVSMTALPVRKPILGRMVRMLAFDGSIPGPDLRVKQGDTLYIALRNRTGIPLAFRCQGSDLENNPAGDAGPGAPAGVLSDGRDSVYRLAFAEPGLYAYHDGYREDMSRALGLYGGILVEPAEADYWNPVDREVPLVFSELALDSGGVEPYRLDGPDHAVLGRFGNVFLTNGDTAFTLTVKRNEYVRFYAVNACNTRVLSLVMNQLWMKVVGSDLGKYEYSILSPGEILGPGERVAYEVQFKNAGTFDIYHQLPDRFLSLGKVVVEEDSVPATRGAGYFLVDTNAAIIQGMEKYRSDFARTPDKELLITDAKPMASFAPAASTPEELAKAAATQHIPGGIAGIVWEDTTGGLNAAATADSVRWIARDLATGLENEDIRWDFKLGSRVVIRLRNDTAAIHPMPHPIRFPGQRVLIFNVDGVPNPDMAWKDEVLVPVGATLDVLLDASTPGDWTAGCRIAEHAGGLRFRYRIE